VDLGVDPVDHEDRNPLNNNPSNLRILRQYRNIMNSSKPMPASGFRGVTKKKNGFWVRGTDPKTNKRIDLGYYKDPVEAAKKYDDFILANYGESAVINFPQRERVT
jgi:hypothetical protein